MNSSNASWPSADEFAARLERFPVRQDESDLHTGDGPTLYQRLAAKEWPAWESLYWRLYGWMTAAVFAKARKSPLEELAAVNVEDVVLEIRSRWPKIMANFRFDSGFQEKDKDKLLRKYISKAVSNAFNSWLRKNRHEQAVQRFSSLELESGAMTPQEQYDLIEIKDLIDSLPEHESELMRWKFTENLTFDQIAKRLSVREGRRIPPSRAYKLVNDIIRELEDRLS
jgi:RNA polymerase sigma factor (sigma-70 family)